MLALEDIPPPHPATTVALLGLVCVLWLYLRVQILRRRMRNVEAQGNAPVHASGWLRRLAAWPGTIPVLALLAAGFAALLVWSL